MKPQLLKEFLAKNVSILRINYVHGSSNIKMNVDRILLNPGEKDDIVLSKDKKYIPVPKDKIYIYPDSGVPRFKLKEYCLKHKISLVKDVDRANSRFLNFENALEKRIRYINYNFVRNSTFLKLLSDNPGYIKKEDEYLLRADTVGIFAIPYYEIRYYQSSAELKFKNPLPNSASEVFRVHPNHDVYSCGVSEVTSPEDLESISNQTNIYSHVDLVLDLSSGMVMDKKLHTDMRRLFESKDTSNHVLAMESMANCDYRASAVYILLLLKEYNSEINNAPNKNHVNFKALKSYFKFTQYMSTDDIVTRLKDVGLDTKTNLSLLIPEVIADLNENKDAANFTITEVKYNDEVLEEDVFEDEPVVVLQRDDEGNPLMSAKFVLMDLSNPETQDNGGEDTPGTGI